MKRYISLGLMTLLLAMSCEFLTPEPGRPAKKAPHSPPGKNLTPGKTRQSQKPKNRTPGEALTHDLPTSTPTLPKASLDQVCQALVAQSKPPPLKNSAEIEERFLASHNNIRKRYNLPLLEWDQELADYAERWAVYLKKNNRCQIKHRSHLGITEGKSYGENLSWYWTSRSHQKGEYHSSPDMAVLDWASECKDYNYDNNSCTPGEQCGHFTQQIWKKSERVGCALTICDGNQNHKGEGRAEIWVCNYDPPGNWVGKKPF